MVKRGDERLNPTSGPNLSRLLHHIGSSENRLKKTQPAQAFTCSVPRFTHFFPTPYIQTTSVLTAAILIYARRAGITAAAGTRLALFLFLVKFYILFSFQLQSHNYAFVLLFFVTASLSQNWAIFAPAATLRCSSHFSCSLSGIKP